MRLLECDSTGEFVLTKDLADASVPPYAVLSHTWGPDTEEIKFNDLTESAGKNKTKTGYEKLRFCAKQVKCDGLKYFWVDTCCIDKSNSTELQEAINSIFRWYQNAVKCYVYLSDVRRPVECTDDQIDQQSCMQDFRRSRWFTRGWTLQELLAPASVEFFSKEGDKIGNKKSLERQISEITGIPDSAIRGSSLSSVSIIERFSWQENRDTTQEEDRAYSLLGICEVYMPLIYGEGRQNAFRRLRKEIDEASKGVKREDFSVAFSLSGVPKIEYFVARGAELEAMR